MRVRDGHIRTVQVQGAIRQKVDDSFLLKQRAPQLLDAAKRAVEIAIENSETAALAYLESIFPQRFVSTIREFDIGGR